MSNNCGGYTYKDHNRCTPCGEWREKSENRCNVCNTKLRTKPRN